MASTDYKKYLNKLLKITVDKGASDLHITVDLKPHVRVDGMLQPIEGESEIEHEVSAGIVEAMLTDEQLEKFHKDREIDFSYSYDEGVRFRVNAYYQRGHVAAACRLIPAKIFGIDELELPAILHDFAKLSQGFVLIVGPAGHGKSTTLAAILDEINHTRPEHIVTIEDPIEYLFVPDQSVISQREVNTDTVGFHRALKSVLRQDPDVLMIGEMRDVESISTAMTAAETGHLVLSTLHTNSAAQTIDRIIDTFPPEKQSQAAAQLAATLVGVVSKRLVPQIGGGRVPACEILLINSAVRNLIRERKSHQIDLVIETNLKSGMVSLNRSLAQLVKAKKITLETAELHSLNPAELKLLIDKI